MKHGRGGHYHSLNHISRKLGEQHEVQIVSVGPAKGGVLEENPFFYKHIDFNGLSFFNLRKEIKEISKSFNPDIFHCFDPPIYNVLRTVISSRKKKIVLNQCGGPNPIEFSHVKNLILFSLENQNWFKGQNKFKETNIYLIPNRVSAIRLEKGFVEYQKKEGVFNFVRICRILKAYQKSVEDSIRLIDKLKQNGINNVRLYVIGTVEEKEMLSDLKNKSLPLGDSVVFITEDIYTKEASKMLYLADAVIGVGRSTMEAASLGIPLLAINSTGNFPVMLDDDNIMDAFRTNFSQRNIFPNYDQDENFGKIIHLINVPAYSEKQRALSKEFFAKYFDIEKVLDAYTNVYEQAMFSKRYLISDMVIIAKMFRRYYVYSKRNRYKD